MCFVYFIRIPRLLNLLFCIKKKKKKKKKNSAKSEIKRIAHIFSCTHFLRYFLLLIYYTPYLFRQSIIPTISAFFQVQARALRSSPFSGVSDPRLYPLRRNVRRRGEIVRAALQCRPRTRSSPANHQSYRHANPH